MRALAPLLFLALAACDREPSFDERYETTEQEIRQKAAEMNEGLSAAKQAEDPARTPSPAER